MRLVSLVDKLYNQICMLESYVKVTLVKEEGRGLGGQYENPVYAVILMLDELPKEISRNDSHVVLFQASEKEPGWEHRCPTGWVIE
jgi:hypothetical protein